MLLLISIYYNIIFCILLVFKDNEQINIEQIQYQAFNYTAIRILNAILKNDDTKISKYTFFEKYVYDTLLSITEIFRNSFSTDVKCKIFLKMEKSLFIKILKKPESKYEPHEVMEILYSKIYILTRLSKKMTIRIFISFFAGQITKEVIYKFYAKYNELDQEITKENISNALVFGLNSTSKVSHHHLFPGNLEKSLFLSENISQNLFENEKSLIFDSQNSVLSNGEFQIKFRSEFNSMKTNFTQEQFKKIYEHPFNQYLIDFFNLMYINFKIVLTGSDEKVLLTLSAYRKELNDRNLLFLPAEVFLKKSVLYNENMKFGQESNQKNQYNYVSDAEFIEYSFLDHFKQHWTDFYVELRYNIRDVLSIIDQFLLLIHPKSLCLDLTRIYTFFYVFETEEENISFVQEFITLTEIIFTKIYCLKIQIDSFCIEINRSRIFDITDIVVISHAIFSPCLYTSFYLKNKIEKNMLQKISFIHYNTYKYSKNTTLKYLNFRNEFFAFKINCDEICIDNIYVKKQKDSNNIRHINAVIGNKNCAIEIQKFSTDNSIETNSDMPKMEEHQILHGSFLKKQRNICKEDLFSRKLILDYENKGGISFDIFLFNSIRVKSRSDSSYLFSIKTPDIKLEIVDCDVELLYKPILNVENIFIRNSILKDLHDLQEKKYLIDHKKNINLFLEQTDFQNSLLSGVFHKIKIFNCSPFLSIFAEFHVIEIIGSFQDYKICDQFNFRIKSKKMSKFLYLKETQYLEATNVIFLDNEFLSFINEKKLRNCKIIANDYLVKI